MQNNTENKTTITNINIKNPYSTFENLFCLRIQLILCVMNLSFRHLSLFLLCYYNFKRVLQKMSSILLMSDQNRNKVK